ncbi:HpcH/HpaI aldolase/citrate lyase family protein [Jatrophihabitans endophyticus]|nr:HpcH/HpaI aldolase/citrate lyase family protein [Jatrophihabitans endophyticus]
MRHFDYLGEDDRERLFLRRPEEFGPADDLALVGVGLGATLYCPGTRPALARDIVRRSAQGVTSVVVCLEDSVPDGELAAAEHNVVAQLRELAAAADPTTLPMIFVRVRHDGQVPTLVAALDDAVRVLTGFVVPKFDEETGVPFLEAVVAASGATGHRLLVMPVLESPQVAYVESRIDNLLATRRLVDKYRHLVPAVRIGATDLSGAYGLRRSPDLTVWDVRVVADAISAVVNVFGRVAGGSYVVTGPVWEYFAAAERLFKPQLRESPFVAHADRGLRSEIIGADLDGLLREIVLDRANGLSGKTVIHPRHVAAVHALSVVTSEEFADATDVLATDGAGGAAASSYGNKMNESKPHTAWAQRTLLRARTFGVAREETSFVDLLDASLHP